MKKIKLVILSLLLVFVTGCMDFNAEMEIRKDKSMVFSENEHDLEWAKRMVFYEDEHTLQHYEDYKEALQILVDAKSPHLFMQFYRLTVFVGLFIFVINFYVVNFNLFFVFLDKKRYLIIHDV